MARLLKLISRYKMKNSKNATLQKHFQNHIENQYKGQIDAINTKIHKRSLSWLVIRTYFFLMAAELNYIVVLWAQLIYRYDETFQVLLLTIC